MTDFSPSHYKRPAGSKLAPLKDRLLKLGLSRDWDYVLHLPLRYEDETAITAISDLQDGVDAQVLGTVQDRKERLTNRPTLEAWINDGTDTLKIRFLHYFPSLLDILEPGKKVLIYGKPRPEWNGSGLEMIHPKTRAAGVKTNLPKSLTPVYPAGEGITQLSLRKRIQTALLNVELKDLLTDEERSKLNLMPLRQAIESLHYPAPDADLKSLQEKTSPGWQRLKFDELLAQQIMLRISRRERDKHKGAPMVPPTDREGAVTTRLYRSLPFKMTNAQKRVWKEIMNSLAGPLPMNRLVQGDVGSGKTVIAAMAAAFAIDNGFQAALMAPTEILAEQHFQKILGWLEPLGIKVVWLTGKLKAKDKREATEQIAQDADLIIGTHALIQQNVKFRNLGLAIIDEQHRFGVEQRLALREPTDNGFTPHLLMLSATPIPRTLAMSYLADVDVSVIDELPPGRQPIDTKLYRLDRKSELITTIKPMLLSGIQAYWVCPLIEESENLDLTAATQTCEDLKKLLPEVSVELLHGKMSSEEKNAVMQRFQSGQTSLLVSTTVIEVGVDVPNARLMIIEHAERFGLSQLHQLRGRVGRGTGKSYCIAVFGDKLSQEGKQRLLTFKETTDGFVIAQKDLELRGPGEFLGARQSGVPLLRFADINMDANLVELAKELARQWVDHNDPRANQHAQRWFDNKEKFLGA